MTATAITPFMLDNASKALTDWTIKRAHRLAKEIGFGYDPVEVGNPETYEGVRAELAECMRTCRGFRVWSGGSEKTIYTGAEGNFAFRFIHDVFHAVFRHDFTLDGELATADRHVWEVSKAFGKDSLEARLVEADTAGQVRYFHDNGGAFIDDQKAFVYGQIISQA